MVSKLVKAVDVQEMWLAFGIVSELPIGRKTRLADFATANRILIDQTFETSTSCWFHDLQRHGHQAPIYESRVEFLSTLIFYFVTLDKILALRRLLSNKYQVAPYSSNACRVRTNSQMLFVTRH